MPDRIQFILTGGGHYRLPGASMIVLLSLNIISACASHKSTPLPDPALSREERFGAVPVPIPTPASALSLKPQTVEIESEYRIKVGDVVEVSLYREYPRQSNDLQQRILVRPDGKISYYFVGDVQASGLTPEELRHELKEGLSYYIRSPEVAVFVVEPGKKRVYIAGEVEQQGVQELRAGQGDTLMDAIFLSKGLTKQADETQAYVIRHDAFIRVNLGELLFRGNQAENVVLQPEDVVYVPQALDQRIMVLGHVQRANAFEISQPIRLSQAIALAGDFDLSAKRDNVKIIRGGLPTGSEPPVVHTVNMSDILAGAREDVYVRRGDIVFVPSTLLGQWNEVMRQILPTLQSFWQATTIQYRLAP